MGRESSQTPVRPIKKEKRQRTEASVRTSKCQLVTAARLRFHSQMTMSGSETIVTPLVVLTGTAQLCHTRGQLLTPQQ